MLELKSLSLRRGPQLLLEGANLRIYPGQKVGLVGPNGCGKSSLLALLLDQLHADAGTVSLPPGWVIAHVAQHTPDSEGAAIDFVLDGDVELRQIQAELARAEAQGDGLRQGELLGRLESIDAYGAESRAARLLHGLGLARSSDPSIAIRAAGGCGSHWHAHSCADPTCCCSMSRPIIWTWTP